MRYSIRSKITQILPVIALALTPGVSIAQAELEFPIDGMYVFSLGVDPSHTETLFAGTRNGIYKSIDGGQNWRYMSNSIKNDPVLLIQIDPTIPDYVRAVTNSGTAYQSSDGGMTWEISRNAVTNAQIESIAHSVDGTNTTYVATRFGYVLKSTDDPGKWQVIKVTTLPILTVLVDPEQSNTVYAGTSGGGVFKSTDGGANWQNMSLGLHIQRPALVLR